MSSCDTCGNPTSNKRKGRCYYCHWRKAKADGRTPGRPRRGTTEFCLECGKAFYTTKHEQKHQRRFCSHECWFEHKRRGLPERFWAQVAKGEGCWLWVGTVSGAYGRYHRRPAHRVAWELENGPIPKGKVIRHRCDVKLCVRPDHLQLGDHADNTADYVARNPKHPRLARNRVRAIKALHAQGFEPEDIASILRIQASTTKAILTST